MVVLSDGEANVQAQNTLGAAEALKQIGVRIYSIIVGNEFDYSQMAAISSNSSVYVHRLPSLAEVNAVSEKVLQQNCEL